MSQEEGAIQGWTRSSNGLAERYSSSSHRSVAIVM
jgi:hypothetical protein